MTADMCRLRSEKEARKHMQRRKKRKREKAAEGGEAPEQPAAQQEQAGADTLVAASDLLAPLQVLCTPPLQQQASLPCCLPFAESTCKAAPTPEALPAQVLRAKHKVKAFAFAPRPSKGSAATCTLALGNNSIEVQTCICSPCQRCGPLLHAHKPTFTLTSLVHEP